MDAHMTAHHHAMPAGHPCCPQIRKNENAAPIEFAASSLPCQDKQKSVRSGAPQLSRFNVSKNPVSKNPR